jgi:menaquinone-dependent protoporphyrinogen oxidase
MNVLVTYGSQRGGTAELAGEVAAGIADQDHAVEVRSAEHVEGVQEWDAVVVGGALYAWNWTRDARQFVNRHRRQLGYLPVWFFSSGPLDESASQEQIQPTWPVRRLIDAVGARGHTTFGGRLEDPSMSQLPQGDWRDFDAARDWGREIGGELSRLSPPSEPLPDLEPPWERRSRTVATFLCTLAGITSIAGGLDMLLWPDGGIWFGLPGSGLDVAPFGDFVVSGLSLLVAVGLTNLAAGLLLWSRDVWSEITAFGAGGMMVVWMASEMVAMQGGHWLQWMYFGLGLLTMMVGFLLWARVRTPWAVVSRNS